MALEGLETLLEDGKGGVFYLPATVTLKSVQATARKAGYAFYHIEGKNIARKEQLMNAVGTSLGLPNHFGENWDALEESLIDLESDAEGFMIYYDHIDGLVGAHPDQFQTFMEICRDAVGSWKEDGTPFVVIFSGTKPPKGVAKLAEKSED